MLITIPLRGIRERLEYVSLCHKEVHCIVGLVCIHLHSIFFVFAVFPLKINWLIVWNCLFPDDKLSEMLSFHSVILQNLCTVLRLTQICCSEKRLRPERGESVRSYLYSIYCHGCISVGDLSFAGLQKIVWLPPCHSIYGYVRIGNLAQLISPICFTYMSLCMKERIYFGIYLNQCIPSRHQQGAFPSRVWSSQQFYYIGHLHKQAVKQQLKSAHCTHIRHTMGLNVFVNHTICTVYHHIFLNPSL